jgi:hypothetical protein
MNPAIIIECTRMIEAMRTALGDMDADEALRSDMLEGCTTIDDVLARLVEAERRAKFDVAGYNASMVAAEAYYGRKRDMADKRVMTARRIIANVMDVAGLSKFKTPHGSISVSAGAARLEYSADFVPPQGYQNIKITPDAKAIKAALEAGETMLGAALVRGEPVLRIV